MTISHLDKKIEKKKAEDAKVGWWGWISGSKPANSGEEDADDDDAGSIHMTEEQKNELYNAIEFDEDKANIASAVDIPKDVRVFLLLLYAKADNFFRLSNSLYKPSSIVVRLR